jgi:Fe-S-cluster containining protein
MKRARRGAGEDRLLDELSVLYQQAEAAYAGSSCPASTECCRFGVTGREPYVTSIEVAAIERAVRRRGGSLSAKKRALPLSPNPDRERVCAFLDVSGRCAIYESRPFGCRTFFCARAALAREMDAAERRELVNRLRGLAARHEPGGDAPRPLSKVFPPGAG